MAQKPILDYTITAQTVGYTQVSPTIYDSSNPTNPSRVTSLYVQCNIAATQPSAGTFAHTAVSTTTGNITITAHGFFTGRVPVVIDTSNTKIWFYSGGAWNSVAGSVGGSLAWPNQFAANESALSTAITSCSSGGGGVICLTASFSITSGHTIPANTILVGQQGNTILTIGTGGSLTLASTAALSYLNITTALSSGTLITMSGVNCYVENCSITVPSNSTTVCINVTGSNNLIFRSTFIGVATPSTGVGVQFTSGSGNVDQYCTFNT
jgi:hypothetical protein